MPLQLRSSDESACTRRAGSADIHLFVHEGVGVLGKSDFLRLALIPIYVSHNRFLNPLTGLMDYDMGVRTLMCGFVG